MNELEDLNDLLLSLRYLGTIRVSLRSRKGLRQRRTTPTWLKETMMSRMERVCPVVEDLNLLSHLF